MFQYKVAGSAWTILFIGGLSCVAQKQQETTSMFRQDTIHIKPISRDTIKDSVFIVSPEVIPFNYFNVKEYIFKNLSYPSEALETEITGTVLVGFTITREGKIDSIKLIRSVHPLLDTEALRLIQEMPQWKPILLYGKPTPFTYEIPVIFNLK